MNTLKDIEEEIKRMQDPNPGIKQILAEFTQNVKMVKGEQGEQGIPGETPVKGVDYFTDAEVEDISKSIQGNIKDGEKGDKGEPGVSGIQGPPGETPIKGIDYFTSKEIKSIEDNVKKAIVLPVPQKVDSTNVVDDAVAAVGAKYKNQFTSLESLVEHLKRGGFRGGGSSGGGSTTPTGTGFTHITAGVQDAAAKLVDTADINASQVTYAKIQNVSTNNRLLGRATAGAGVVEEIHAGSYPYPQYLPELPHAGCIIQYPVRSP